MKSKAESEDTSNDVPAEAAAQVSESRAVEAEVDEKDDIMKQLEKMMLEANRM